MHRDKTMAKMAMLRRRFVMAAGKRVMAMGIWRYCPRNHPGWITSCSMGVFVGDIGF